MLDNINIGDILFLDIETVPQYPDFSFLDASSQHLWEEKANSSSFRKKEEEQTAAHLYERAGIYAEFGKIVCISTGYLYQQQNEWAFRVKSCFHDDERLLLHEFNQLLESFAQRHNTVLCAHNGKEFDFPYIARRMLINGIHLPAVLNTAGKKPWEVSFLDTMDLWRFGDYKSYTSLKLLTHIFGIPSPKDDIDGSQVGNVYWKDKDLPRIARYCEKDVLAVAQILLRYKALPIIPADRVSSSSFPANSTATSDTIRPASASE